MATPDLTKATRELFVRSLVDEVHMKTPFVEELQRRRQITYKGGKYIERLADTDTSEELWQSYIATDALTDQKKTTLAKPRFTWKYAQYPMRYDVDEYTQNIQAGNEEQLLDLSEHLVRKSQDDTKLRLCSWLFNSGSATAVADGGTEFQSLVSALLHDNTYGTLTRSLSGGTNDWWQGADPANLVENITTSSQNTATNLTAANMRKWVNETDISHYMNAEDDLMVLMCPTLWDKFAAELESKVIYKPADKQKQGIRSMIFDGHEIVSVPYLQKSATMKKWLFILNLRWWELRIHSARNFLMLDFKHQADQSNGYDFWLARIMVSGNFCCWKPNSSMFLRNVT